MRGVLSSYSVVLGGLGLRDRRMEIRRRPAPVGLLDRRDRGLLAHEIVVPAIQTRDGITNNRGRQLHDRLKHLLGHHLELADGRGPRDPLPEAGVDLREHFDDAAKIVLGAPFVLAPEPRRLAIVRSHQTVTSRTNGQEIPPSLEVVHSNTN